MSEPKPRTSLEFLEHLSEVGDWDNANGEALEREAREIVERERLTGELARSEVVSAERTAQVVAYQRWLYNTARVYRLSGPVPWEHHSGASGETRYVVVSVGFDGGPQAMAFACDEHGETLPLGERLRADVGVAYGTIDHDDVLRAMGFAVLPPAADAKRPEPEPPLTEQEVRDFAERWNRTIEESLGSAKRALAALRESGGGLLTAAIDRPTGDSH